MIFLVGTMDTRWTVLVNFNHPGIKTVKFFFVLSLSKKMKWYIFDTINGTCFKFSLICRKQDIWAPALGEVHSGICCVCLSPIIKPHPKFLKLNL